jgi:acetyltransferase
MHRDAVERTPRHYPAHLERTFFTTRGDKLFMRPVLPRDVDLLRQGFARLSRSSVFQRFHGHRDSLSDETCRYLTTLDYRTHMALIALVPARDEAVGVARYCLGPGDGLAEAALVVVDDWQGRGVGRQLLDQLVLAARTQGIVGFQAQVLGENRRMLRIIRHSGYTVHADHESGTFFVRILFDEKSWWG